jgi:endo-1,4-beta-xylanase
VEPADAANKTIVWSVKTAGTTGAAIGGATLTATAAGPVTVTATIADGLSRGENYTQDFAINVAFKAVTGIGGVPEEMAAGNFLVLNGAVEPADATNRTIVWSVAGAGTTGATVTGNTLSVPAVGQVTLLATIAGGLDTGDYTKSFIISVIFKAVSNISGVPTTAWVGEPLTLSGALTPPDASKKTIVWSVTDQGTTGAAISNGNILNTTAAGTATLSATIAGGLADGGDYTQGGFTITVTAPTGTFAIKVGFNRGIEITGSSGNNVIRKTGTPSSLTISADGYTDVAWYVDGGATPVASGDTLTIDAADYGTQLHSVTFTGKKDGTPYSQAIPFMVVIK